MVSHHDNFTQTDAATVVFIDYGGYCQIPFADLRQIRSDYMTMPQQAVECRLANIRPITAGNEGATGDASQIEFAFETSVDLEKELRNMVSTDAAHEDSGAPGTITHPHKSINVIEPTEPKLD